MTLDLPVKSRDGIMNAPLLERHDHDEVSVFRPENMLREARRQKGLRGGAVPPVCILDPDGDIVEHVRLICGATLSLDWACYHTELWEWDAGGIRCGVVGYAVGAAFAVLVGEQLFASGCELLLSVASAGQIKDLGSPPYHILIDRALRDEGTSYHYLPPAAWIGADADLIALAQAAFATSPHVIHRGATWTTDAPFRETETAIAARQKAGIVAVEMEAAALYAFAKACDRPVLCLAHVTNQLGRVEGDFEKGAENGALDSLDLVNRFARAWQDRVQSAALATP
ncbi:nucleoside phosphorylase [Beijerinckia sp. L45]|uniref:nucleoside phosphorylase n=1 Tax=Beijerinckia sp. L45 TaxID=1641855 RepID=UPI001FEF79B3|nr:nucleoside phosphorylase [Beijerinckia sp. L45]